MSSSTALGQSKGRETIEKAPVLFAVAIAKDPQKDSFPCYWLLPQSPQAEAAAKAVVTVENLKEVLTKILIDPLFETLWCANLTDIDSWRDTWRKAGYNTIAVKQFLPGVTDNLAHVVEEALEMENLPCTIKVASGRIYLSKGQASSFDRAPYQLYHPIV